MLNDIDDKSAGGARQERVRGVLGRAILTDVVVTTIGTSFVVLAVVLMVHALWAN